jgi:micrococcal nuclease
MYEYKATLIRAVDGDTAILAVDLGFHLIATMDFRLLGINTPELKGSTRAAGLVAKAELERLCAQGSLRISTEKSDKYGRWLASIDVLAPDGSVLFNVNKSLVDGGFAVPYMV